MLQKWLKLGSSHFEEVTFKHWAKISATSSLVFSPSKPENLLYGIIHITEKSRSTLYFQQIHNLDSDVFFTVCLTTVALVNLFVYCYFGKIGSDSFARMPDCLYCILNWRELPPELKMYVVLIIRNMQKPIYYYGFSVAVMDLNTFIYVRTKCFDLIFWSHINSFSHIATSNGRHILYDVQDTHRHINET